MSPVKDEIRACRYTLWIFSMSTPENTNENRIVSVRSQHHKQFSKAQHLAFWALWWEKSFCTCSTEPHWWVMGRTKHVFLEIVSEFIHWALCRTLMRTEYFFFVHRTTRALAKLNTWCFEHSVILYISCSLLVDPSHTGEPWEGRNMCLWLYALNLFTEDSGEH